MDGHDQPVEDHWWYPGEVATIAAAGADGNFHDMLGNSTYTSLRLSVVRRHHQAASAFPASLVAATGHGTDCSPSWFSTFGVMAAWLYPIVSGVDHADDSSKVPSMVKGSYGTMVNEYKVKIPATDQDTSGAKNTGTRSDSSEKRKSAPGESSRTRSSHHSETHNSTERRRRCKISDRLRTLQQLVPGCDKSNQASTLEQTIQYMKSLQQQVQSASAAGAMYPVVQPPPTAAVTMPIPATAAGQVRPGTVVPMIPYGAMFPYAYYHAMMMPAAASSAMPMMMPAPATFAAPEGQCAVSTEQQRHKEKGKRRL